MEFYQIRGGDKWKNGVLFGWTGAKCETCNGSGEKPYSSEKPFVRSNVCVDCTGTGDKYGVMPVQPKRHIVHRLELNVPTEIECVYTNHRGEVRPRRLCVISLCYAATPFHPEYQWFMECLDMERRNQNETEGARFYPSKDIEIKDAPCFTMQELVANGS